MRKKKSTQQLVGIERVTDSSVLTAGGELTFYLVQPTNLNVLPESGVRTRVTALLNVLKTSAEMELLSLDSMPQPQAVTSQIKIEGGAVIQLLYHMSRVFRGNMPVIPPALRIDSKRRRRLQEKRMAMGHKRDDHEDEQLHHVNDNAMQ